MLKTLGDAFCGLCLLLMIGSLIFCLVTAFVETVVSLVLIAGGVVALTAFAEKLQGD